MSDKPQPAPSPETEPGQPSGPSLTLRPEAFVETVSADVDKAAFRWPTPPFASYPAARAQMEHEPCEIVGLNGRVMQGRLNFFVPTERVAHIQVPPARTTMPLRFSQFRTLRLTKPLDAIEATAGLADHAQVLAHCPQTEYRVHLVAGGMLEGQTVGHVENDFGIFLFPPFDDSGAVLRIFVPK